MTDGKSEEFLRRTGAAGRPEQWTDPMGPDFNINYTSGSGLSLGQMAGTELHRSLVANQQSGDVKPVCFHFPGVPEGQREGPLPQPVPGSRA